MGCMKQGGPRFASRRLLLAGLAALAWPAFGQPAQRRLVVGVEDALYLSGLATRLAQTLERDTGLVIAWRAGASGALLARLERGELDAAITHAPDIELALSRQNLVHDRRPIANTALLLVGPPRRPQTRRAAASGDPAGVAGERDVVAALARIKLAGERGEAAYVASGEVSGVELMERSLWAAVGPSTAAPWWHTAGTGAGAVLAKARALSAYALVERGVWQALGSKSGLAALSEGDARLAVTYHVMRAFRAPHPGGKLMVNWLAGHNGQGVVAGYGRGYRSVA